MQAYIRHLIPASLCCFLLFFAQPGTAQQYCKYCFEISKPYSYSQTEVTTIFKARMNYSPYNTEYICHDSEPLIVKARDQKIAELKEKSIPFKEVSKANECDEAQIIDQIRRNEEQARRDEEQARRDEEEKRRAEERKLREEAERKQELKEAARLEKERQDNLKNEQAKALERKTDQIRDEFRFLLPKPGRIPDGWQYVTLIQQDPILNILEKQVVYVRDNRVVKYLAKETPSSLGIEDVSTGEIQQAETRLRYKDAYYEVYFIPLLRQEPTPQVPETGKVLIWTNSLEERAQLWVEIYKEGRLVGSGSVDEARVTQPAFGDKGSFSLSALKPGAYTYVARKAGSAKHWQGNLEVKPSQTTVRSLDYGTVGFWTDHALMQGAKIILYGDTLGPMRVWESAVAPANCQQLTGQWIRLPVGNHTYQLVSEQNKALNRKGEFDVKTGSCERIHLQSHAGQVSFLHKWPGQRAFQLLVNDQIIDTLDPISPEQRLFLPAGRHHYKAVDLSQADIFWQGTVDMKAGEQVSISLDPSPFARVEFNNNWSSAKKLKFHINQQKTVELAPLESYTYFSQPGALAYSVSAETYKWFQQSDALTLSAGESEKVTINHQPNGKVVFYTMEKVKDRIEVSLDDTKSTTTIRYRSKDVPDCGSRYGGWISLPVGTYSFTAKMGAKQISGKMEVTDGNCSKIRISF